MIGGINSANASLIQTGNSTPARERSDVARAPAASPQARDQAVRQDLGSPRQQQDTNAPNQPVTPEDSTRRVEARRAAEDAQLERFRADEVNLPTARALTTFAGVAAAGQEYEGNGPVAGIDILV